MFEKIKKDMQRAKQNRIRDDMVIRMARLKALIGDRHKSGWDEYYSLIKDYIDKCEKRKVATRLDIASKEVLHEIQLLDHEIYILNWLLNIPSQYIERAENELERNKRNEERHNNSKKA